MTFLSHQTQSNQQPRLQECIVFDRFLGFQENILEVFRCIYIYIGFIAICTRKFRILIHWVKSSLTWTSIILFFFGINVRRSGSIIYILSESCFYYSWCGSFRLLNLLLNLKYFPAASVNYLNAQFSLSVIPPEMVCFRVLNQFTLNLRDAFYYFPSGAAGNLF